MVWLLVLLLRIFPACMGNRVIVHFYCLLPLAHSKIGCCSHFVNVRVKSIVVGEKVRETKGLAIFTERIYFGDENLSAICCVVILKWVCSTMSWILHCSGVFTCRSLFGGCSINNWFVCFVHQNLGTCAPKCSSRICAWISFEVLFFVILIVLY